MRASAVVLVLLLALAGLALAQLAVVTRASPDSLKPWQKKFKEETGISFDIIFLKPELWWAYIREGKADVLLAGAPLLYEALYEDGLLAPIDDVPAVKEIPDRLGSYSLKKVGPNGRIYFVAYTVLSYGMGVNTEFLERAKLSEPRRWADLASLEYARYLIKTGTPATAVARPTKSTSTATMLQLILEIYGWREGWRILTELGGNAKFLEYSEDVRNAIERGDAAIGLMVDYFAFLTKDAGAPVKFVAPEDGTDLLIDPIAMPVNAKHVEEAKEFINWVLTRGQADLINVYLLPANPKAFEGPEVNRTKAAVLKAHYERLLRSKLLGVPPSKLASYYHFFMHYFESTIIDVQDKLLEAWTKLVEAYDKGLIDEGTFRALERLLTAPVNFTDPTTGETVTTSFDVAVRLNDLIKANSTARDLLREAWRRAARDKYELVLAKLQELERSRAAPGPNVITIAVALALIAIIVASTYFVAKRRHRV